MYSSVAGTCIDLYIVTCICDYRRCLRVQHDELREQIIVISPPHCQGENAIYDFTIRAIEYGQRLYDFTILLYDSFETSMDNLPYEQIEFEIVFKFKFV